jgi:hypothetical protein
MPSREPAAPLVHTRILQRVNAFRIRRSVDAPESGRVDAAGMNPKTSAQILIVLSIAYGVTIGILGALDSAAISIVAIVGALVLGGLWVVRGIVSRP